MTRKLTTLLSAVAVLAGLGAASTVFAQENTSSSQPPQAPGMMGNHGGMMGMMGMMGQMGPDLIKQMTAMIDNCNRMMEGMSDTPTEPDNERAPDHHG